jgi:tetratricopeptide (TPR) repeat protein
MAAAELELRGPKPEPGAAAKFLETAFQAHPKDVRVGLMLADVQARRGKTPEAVAVLQKAADGLDVVNDQYLTVLDRLLDLRETGVATRLAERFNQDEQKVFSNYFRGRLALLADDWPTALRLLGEAAPALRGPHSRELYKRAMTGIGQCYAKANNPDQQLTAFEAALAVDPAYAPALGGKADALSKLGRLPEATALYRLVARANQGERLTYARLVLLQILGQPEDARDWTSLDDAIGPPPHSTDLLLLKAEALAFRGQAGKAAEVLDEAKKADPKNPAVYVTASRIRGGGKASEVLAGLEAARKDAGDSADLRVAEAAARAAGLKRPTPDDLRRLAAGAETFSPADQFKLWSGLGEAASRAADVPGMRAEAITFFRKAADVKPTDLTSRAVLVDLGMAEKRFDVADKALDEIAKAEGASGPLHTLGVVARKLPDAHGDKPLLADLRAKAEAVKAVRPSWGRVYLALAQIDELEGLNDAALANLRKALDLGELQDWVVRRTVELLRERRQFKEAAAVLNRVNSQTVLPDDLQRFRSLMNLFSATPGEKNRGEIDRVAPKDSRDARVLLLRGALLAAIHDDRGAEAAYRGAVQYGEASAETWTALIGHLAGRGDRAAARDLLVQAEDRFPKATAPADTLISLAGCRELVGDATGAEAFYRAAVAKAPDDLKANRELVTFLQRAVRTAEADQILTALENGPAQNLARWARRHHALSLLTRSDPYAFRREALRLIDANLAVSKNDPEDVKAKAVVQTVDPATRETGVQTLRDFARWDQLGPDELYLLGRLAFDQGKMVEAEQYFVAAAQPRPGLSPEHLAALVRLYAATNNLSRAEQALDRLKASAPRGWDAAREEARLRRKAQIEAEQSSDLDGGKRLGEQARAAVMAYPDLNASPRSLSQAAAVLEEIGWPADAEELYKKAAAAGKGPGAHVGLAMFYLRRGEAAKAVELVKANDTPPLVATSAQLLSGAARANPTPGVVRDVESWLTKKLADHANDPAVYPTLLVARAELFDAQGRSGEAIEAYRDALTRGPNEMATNNLAMLLALARPVEAGEAVRMMTDLIAVRGPVPSYLDTRAVAQIVAGRPADAVKDLELALAQQRRPVFLFHLAWAQDNLNQRGPRDAALAEARRGGITASAVHPLEAGKYAELVGPAK